MSLAEIAEIAGVSKATVSRVLTKSKKVSPEVTEKVNQAIKSTGCKPRTRKKTKQTRNIAMLIVGRDLFMEYSPARWKMLYGIQQTLEKKEVNLIVQQVAENEPVPANISKQNIDGLVVLGKPARKKLLDSISDIPSIWINSQGSNDRDHALARNQMAGQMAAQYLVSKGHKHLAFLRVFREHQAITMDGDFFRFTATRSNCSVHIIKGMDSFPDNDSLESWGRLQTTVEKAMKELAELKPRPTGLFVPVGQVVVICYEKLEKLGIKPGRDIDIIGCGCENAMLAGLSPRPANISINAETIGKRAVEQLLYRIDSEAKNSSTNITVMPTLSE